MKKLLLTLVLIQISISAIAQQEIDNKLEKDYRKNPRWIAMMDDTLTNYFDAVKAYEVFWDGKIKPPGEDDLLKSEDLDESKTGPIKRLQNFMRKREASKNAIYAFDCKKFRHWVMMTEPWVQDDGRILTPSERLLIWEKSRI